MHQTLMRLLTDCGCDWREFSHLQRNIAAVDQTTPNATFAPLPLLREIPIDSSHGRVSVQVMDGKT